MKYEYKIMNWSTCWSLQGLTEEGWDIINVSMQSNGWYKLFLKREI